jgi:hypothetical protein
MNHKELIARLRVGAGIEREKVVYSGWAPLADEAAEAIEELQAEVEMWKATSNAVIDMEKATLRLERDTLRQQLAESQAEVSRLEPLQFRQAPCHKFCEATAFEIEIRNLKKQLSEARRGAETYQWLRDNSASISWNPSRFNSEIVSGFAHAGTGYLGFSFEDAIKEAMKGIAGTKLYTHPAPQAVPAKKCKYGDPLCPCQDGDACHYEGKDAWSVPKGAV